MRAIGAGLLLVVAIAASGCLSRDESAKLDAEHAVKAHLKDPDSARFSNEYVVRRPISDPKEPGDVYVCGFVNAKNGFGGYAGDQRFVASGNWTDEYQSFYYVHIEDSDRRSVTPCGQPAESTFEKLAWNEGCVDESHPPTYTGERIGDCE